jgi:transposase-like protein
MGLLSVYSVFCPIRHRTPEGSVRQKSLALGVLPDGSRDVLGIWIEQTEGAKFWLKVWTYPDFCGRGIP